ncbi:MAG: hypothetical protein IKM28_03660 [Lachnospiraceae bacterium]|nr:hypothetical protein [Lachnospiraceae bacterium]
MNSINTKRNLSCCGCMAVVFLLLLYFCLQKEGTFLDELLTYDLSNRHSPRVEFIVSHLTHNPPSVLINDLQDILENGKENSRIYKDFKSWEQAGMETSVWHQPTYFASFLEVEKGSRFDFLSVLYNSIYNSSPPLYYHLVHLICSLFPETFSLWYGLIINLVFMLLSCLLLYRLAEKYCGGMKYAWLITLCYVLSIGGISTLLIIRMYAIYTFFILAFLSINLQIVKQGFTLTRRTTTAYILCAVLGFYTQYYFIIYAGLLAALLFLFLLLEKKNPLSYLKASLAAGLISLVVWPFSVKHIFFDSFGASTFQTAASGHFLPRLWAYIQVAAEALFVGQPWLLLLVFLLLAVGFIWMLCLIKKGRLPAPTGISRLLPVLLFIPSVGYFCLTALSAPFISDRYIMCIFPILLLGMLGGGRYLLNSLSVFSGKNIRILPLLAAASILITSLGLTLVEKNYVYSERRERNKLLTDAENTAFIYVSEKNGWQYKSCLDLMSRCRKTAVILPEQIPQLSDGYPPSAEQTLVGINRSFNQRQILSEIIQSCSLEGKRIVSLPGESDDYTEMFLIQ